MDNDLGSSVKEVKFVRPQGVDSSNWFNQRNYRGRIREVRLTQRDVPPNNLSFMMSFARERGYKTFSLSIINIVHGGSPDNEPAEAVFLSKSYPNKVDNPEALIVRTSDSLYDFYEKKYFRFIA